MQFIYSGTELNLTITSAWILYHTICARCPCYTHHSRRAPPLIYSSNVPISTIWIHDQVHWRNSGTIHRVNFDHFCPLPKLSAPSSPNSLNFKLALLNALSISSKASLITNIITQKKVDMFYLSETWQQPGFKQSTFKHASFLWLQLPM